MKRNLLLSFFRILAFRLSDGKSQLYSGGGRSRETARKALLEDRLPDSSDTATWSKTSDPGDIAFIAIDNLSTRATFSKPGDYVLAIEATDGELAGRGELAASVTSPFRVSRDLVTFHRFYEGSSAPVPDPSGYGAALDNPEFDAGNDIYFAATSSEYQVQH